MIFSLQKRFLLLLFLPVTLILVACGVSAFFYARAYLVEQWAVAARLKLEQAAHQITMQLDDKLTLINLIAKAQEVPNPNLTQAFLIQQLSQKEGVRFVFFDIQDSTDEMLHNALHHHADEDTLSGLYTMELCGEVGFCAPIMDPNAVDRALKVARLIPAQDNQPAKRLTVRISFDSFLDPIKKMDLWPGSIAGLVTSTGQILSVTDRTLQGRRMLGETGDPVEKQALAEMRRKMFGKVFGPGHPPEVVLCFYKIPSINWYIVLWTRGEVILEPVIRFRFFFSIAGVAGLLLILLLIRLSTKSLVNSVSQISGAARRVRRGDYSKRLPEDRSDELGQLKRTFNDMMDGLKQRDLIEQTFGRYVDKKVAEELMNRPEALRLGGEKRTVTILMSDLRDFTPFSEKMEPELVIYMLNRYFSRMIAVIERYRGIIVDFYGDSILVFFNGVEEDVPGRALDAAACGMDMQRAHEDFVKESLASGLPEVSMGIGIHTGAVVVGNIGTESRAKYGIVGSDVNLTDRIQATASAGKVVVSEQTYDLISSHATPAREFRVCLKGVEEDKMLYELESLDEDAVKERRRAFIREPNGHDA